MVSDSTILRIDGQVTAPRELTFDDLAAIEPADQIPDVSRFDPRRQGGAVKLSALLELAGAKDSAQFIGLHGTRDDFHASIPLDPVRDRAFLIYQLDGAPLDVKSGGPFRFFIPDHAACHTDEIDECANVKFVDHIELTAKRGLDNRPDDDQAHARLHQQDH